MSNTTDAGSHDSGVNALEHVALEPCPFCYPHAACDEYPPAVTKEINGSKYWCVHAPCCDFYGPLHLTPDEAAGAWNRRGLVSSITGNEVLETLEKVLSADPQAFLGEEVVYSVTQGELLQFASQIAPRHARDAITALTGQLKRERVRAEECMATSSAAITALEKDLAALTSSSEIWKTRAGLAKGVMEKNRYFREHAEDVFVSLAGLIHDLQSLDEGDMPPHSRATLTAMESEMRALKHKAHVAVEYPTPLDAHKV